MQQAVRERLTLLGLNPERELERYREITERWRNNNFFHGERLEERLAASCKHCILDPADHVITLYEMPDDHVRAEGKCFFGPTIYEPYGDEAARVLIRIIHHLPDDLGPEDD